MKKIAYTAGLAMAVAGGIWWSLSQAPGPQPEQSAAQTAAASSQQRGGANDNRNSAGPDPDNAAEAGDRSVPEEIRERVATMNARRPGRHFTAQEVARAVARRDMWSSTDAVATEKIPLEEEQLHDGRQLVQFSPLKLESLQAGDRVAIDITEANTAYEVVIDRVKKHDYDSISWYGHIDGNDGQRYQVSFTRGESLTVGGIDTPAGNFQLQAHDDAGWIASSGSLFETSGETDAIYPPDMAAQ